MRREHMPEITQNFQNHSAAAANVRELVNRRPIPKDVKIVEKSTDTLDRDSFLKLLVTQLGHQDPLKPMQDREFISQMAQFSALEQMQNVASEMKSLKSFQANLLVGRHVTGKDYISGKSVGGVVDRVIYDNSGEVFLRINGRSVKMKDIQSVEVQRNYNNNVSRETQQPVTPANNAVNSYSQNQKLNTTTNQNKNEVDDL